MQSLSRTKPYSAPDGVRIYAIGDIHGCAQSLDRLTTAILADSGDAPANRVIVYLGDYVDRGPDSKGVLERLLSPPEGFSTHYLRGNHEQALLDFVANPLQYRVWPEFWGCETLLSYGVTPPHADNDDSCIRARDQLLAALPPAHLNFLHDLPHSLSLGDYLFVHAGIRPGIAIVNQSPEDLLWIRKDFLESREDFGVVVVHGHTPVSKPVLMDNRISVDTQAYASGTLTAAVLQGTTCRFLQS